MLFLYNYEITYSIIRKKKAEKDSREEITKAFRLFDDDETGKISFKNLFTVVGVSIDVYVKIF